MKMLAAALVIAATTACGFSSAAESMAVFADLAAKGQKVGKEVADYVKRNRPEAAVAVMNRHIREVDDTIEKVQKDATISGSHKVELLKQLRGYRSDLAQSRSQLRVMADFAGQARQF